MLKEISARLSSNLDCCGELIIGACQPLVPWILQRLSPLVAVVVLSWAFVLCRLSMIWLEGNASKRLLV